MYTENSRRLGERTVEFLCERSPAPLRADRYVCLCLGKVPAGPRLVEARRDDGVWGQDKRAVRASARDAKGLPHVFKRTMKILAFTMEIDRGMP
jgi:hypothetical protein